MWYVFADSTNFVRVSACSVRQMFLPSPAYTSLLVCVSHILFLLVSLSMIKGLLTVDPESRLKLSDLKENSWLQGGASMSTTPLCTPDVLESSGPTVRTYVNATYKVKALQDTKKKVLKTHIECMSLKCLHLVFYFHFCPHPPLLSGFQPW